MNRWVPTLPEVSRETLIVLAGAVVAGLLLRLPIVQRIAQDVRERLGL